MNQNLNVELDLTMLNEGIRLKSVVPQQWTDKTGKVHNVVTLFVKECKKQDDKKTHNVTVKSSDGWKNAVGADGNVLFVGRAVPSKFQPGDNNNGNNYNNNHGGNDDSTIAITY